MLEFVQAGLAEAGVAFELAGTADSEPLGNALDAGRGEFRAEAGSQHDDDPAPSPPRARQAPDGDPNPRIGAAGSAPGPTVERASELPAAGTGTVPAAAARR